MKFLYAFMEHCAIFSSIECSRANTHGRVLRMDDINDTETFRYWGEQLYLYRQGRVSIRQAMNLRSQLKHIYEFIGNDSILEIKPRSIDAMLTSLAHENPITKKPMAKKTLKDIRNTASAVFDMAIENDVSCKNSAKGREIPRRAPQRRRRALTNEEQQWILETPHRARLSAIIMMFAGLRRGELIPLTWQDIDFDRLTITVNKSVYAIQNIFYIKEGVKTGIEGRTINMPLDLALELENARKLSSSKYICCKKNGEMHTPTSWRALWKSYQRALNFAHGVIHNKPKSIYNPHGVPCVINNITPHMLRHTYATLLYMSGVDVLTASKLMGHADVKTTLEIYTHIQESMVEKSIDKFDSYVSEMYSKIDK